MTKSKCLVCLDQKDPDKQFLYKPRQERITVNLIQDTRVVIDGFTLYRDEIIINYCPKCGRDINLERQQMAPSWEDDTVLYTTETNDCNNESNQ